MSVDTTKVGLYEITYSSTDESGNTSQTTRTVSVSSLALDPIENTEACQVDQKESAIACQTDQQTQAHLVCPPGVAENPLETVCIPCGARIYGCTDSEALNYNIRATHDDGSCVYLQPPTIDYNNASIPINSNFILIPTIGGGAFTKIEVSQDTEIPDWFKFDNRNGRFNGETPASFEEFSVKVIISNSKGLNHDTFLVSPFYPPIIPGCTNPKAGNYNPLANQDNGSCQIVGCRDPQAPNYDPEANIDGFCIKYGCTAANALNWDPDANTDDGSCVFCKAPFVTARKCSPQDDPIDWSKPLEICGTAYNTQAVTVLLQGLSAKNANVVNNQWSVTFSPEELTGVKEGSVLVTVSAQTNCGAASEEFSLIKTPTKKLLPFFVGITASTGSQRSIQTISNFRINDKPVELNPQFTSGEATEISEGVWRLTTNAYDTGGGIWANSPEFTGRVKASFSYTIGGDSDADGFALIFSAFPFLAGLGGGLGYQGGNPNSIAVEIDSYHNPHDPNNSHIALVWKGNIIQHLALASRIIRPGGTLEAEIDDGVITVRFNGNVVLTKAIEFDKILQGLA